MSQTPTISIITPAYNDEKYLAQTIESVLAQTVADWELIVVDDGSQDNTVAIAQGFASRDPRIRMVQKPNGGVADARNRGFVETCPGTPFVIFLDHDDVWEPDALAMLRGALSAQPEAIAAHGIARCIDHHGCPVANLTADWLQRDRHAVVGKRLVAVASDAPTTFAIAAYHNCILTMGQTLFRRSILHSVGPLDVATVPTDDYDLYLRALQFGDFVFVNQVVIGWRLHGNNTSLQEERMLRQLHNVRRKLFTSPTLTSEQRQLLLYGYRFTERSIYLRRAQWARDALAKGQIVGAAKQFRHAIHGYARFLWGSI